MDTAANTQNAQIKVVLAKDNLRAWIELPLRNTPKFTPPDESQLQAALEAKDIDVTPAVQERIKALAALCTPNAQEQGPAEIPERYLIAEGTPAIDAKHGAFVWAEKYQKNVDDWQGDAPINYYSANSIVTIDANEEIGRITPPSPGVQGRDVFGKEIIPRLMTGNPILLGNGLRNADYSKEVVVTETAGRLEQDGQKLSMKEVLQINGDIDFSAGNVDSVIDVNISGEVKPKFTVKTTKSITIGGAVETAELNAGMDIQIRGGLFGRDSAYVVCAGQNIAVSICDGARIVAGGDLCVTKEIINSHIDVAGELKIEHGSIIGGELHARAGAKIRNAGSELNVVTRLSVGVDGAVLYRSQQMEAQIRKQRDQAAQIQKMVTPLISNMKRLSPAQREQATELMAKSMDIETAADTLEQERQAMIQAATPPEPAYIDITGTVYPGVILVFGLREATVKNPLKGPLRVEERQVKGVTEIVMVNPLTGSVIPLQNGPVDVRRFKQSEEKSGGNHGNKPH